MGLGTWEREILECRVMQSGLRYLGLGTWERKILENRAMQSGLKYLGLGTWERKIWKYRVMQSGLRYLGLGTWEREILEYKANSIRNQLRTPQCKHCLGNDAGARVSRSPLLVFCGCFSNFTYCCCKILWGSSGVLGALSDRLWDPFGVPHV